jgi:hypothetical protein
MSSGDVIGTIGVTLLLIAFALNLANKWSATSVPYLLLNVIGAGLTCVSSYIIQFWPFVVLEGVWTLSSLVMLIRSAKK